MIKKILLTGASGFIGRHVLRVLLEKSLNVRVVLRDKSSIAPVIRGRVEVKETSDVFHETFDWWSSALDDIDTVIHLAWYVGDDYLNSPLNLDCCLGTLRMVESLRRSQISHFVVVGTCLEYKPSIGPLTVSDEIEPDTIYGVSKFTTHKIAQQLLHGTGITMSWCRMFFLFGDGQRSNALLPRLKKSFAIGKDLVIDNPASVIDLMDVSQAAVDITERVLHPQNGVFNICSGIGRSVRDIVESLRDGAQYPQAVRYAPIEDRPQPMILIGIPTPYVDPLLHVPRIPYTRPAIDSHDASAVKKAAQTCWGPQRGQYVRLFEKQFASMVGAEFAVATSSATGALHIVLAALDLTTKDEVILADTNWIATLAPIEYCKATPVFVDVDEETLCIDPEQVQNNITNNTKAIIATHLYGNLCDMDKLISIARLHNVSIIEDAAEALGSIYHSQHVGTLGDAGVFSFHGSKTITTGEGGMIVTNNMELYNEVQVLAEHGRSPSSYVRGDFVPERIGFKYKMTDIQAALGLSQLKRINRFVQRKREILSNYRELLKFEKKISLNPIQANCVSGAWMPVVQWDVSYGVQADAVIMAMKNAGVEVRPLFRPLSGLGLGYGGKPSPVGDAVYQQGINLPSYVDMTNGDQKTVVNTLLEVLEV